jgi:uroporphyrinogen decarboxylase
MDRFGNEVYVRGNCEQAPFSLASMIRGTDGWFMDLLDPGNNALAHRLLEYCTAITTQFVELMAGTGVHMVSNGDSVAGPEMVSPAIYRHFALPYERKVIQRAHDLGLPYILHICGNAGLILDDMMTSGADGLELDYKTDQRRAHKVMRDRAVFIGNVDPSGVLAMGTIEDVERETGDLLRVFADTPRFVLNAGCAIPPITPPENIRVFVKTARLFR